MQTPLLLFLVGILFCRAVVESLAVKRDPDSATKRKTCIVACPQAALPVLRISSRPWVLEHLEPFENGFLIISPAGGSQKWSCFPLKRSAQSNLLVAPGLQDLGHQPTCLPAGSQSASQQASQASQASQPASQPASHDSQPTSQLKFRRSCIQAWGQAATYTLSL